MRGRRVCCLFNDAVSNTANTASNDGKQSFRNVEGGGVVASFKVPKLNSVA
jgi:hypothetical protein